MALVQWCGDFLLLSMFLRYVKEVANRGTFGGFRGYGALKDSLKFFFVSKFGRQNGPRRQ